MVPQVGNASRRRSAMKTRLPREHHQDTARHQGVKTKGKELGMRSRELRENPKRKVEPLSIRINGDRKIVHKERCPCRQRVKEGKGNRKEQLSVHKGKERWGP